MNEEQNTTIKKESAFKKPLVQSILGITVIALALGGYLFWQRGNGTILIENSDLEAPVINLAPDTAGTLNALYVHSGDTITANTPVALVGTTTITSKQSGIIISAHKDLGSFESIGQSVVSMVHPEDMRVVGAIDENKGLEDIRTGQPATFTVDTFGNTVYKGIVDEVSATSVDTGVVFSISDKRPIKKFNVKVRFDTAAYPELKNGMSAKITVYTK